MTKQAIVTGAFGFLGRHVAKQLAVAGWKVNGIGHGYWKRDEYKRWGITEWNDSDITIDALIRFAEQPDAILHCAGSGSVGFSLNHPYQDFQRTVATTLAVLEFGRVHAPDARIVYPSSAGVYGHVQKLPILETDPLCPTSPYGVHKRMAEELCSSYARHFDLQTSIVRLFSVYGIGLRKQLLWDAAQKITRGENEFFGTGEEVRDWLHVDDAAKLLIKAIEHASHKCPVVNGGAGTGTSVREALSCLFESFNGGKPVFTGMSRAGDPPGYVADISSALAWDWQPTIAFKDGLRDYAEWFKSELK